MQFRKPLLLGGPLRPVEGHLHDVAKPDLCADGKFQNLEQALSGPEEKDGRTVILHPQRLIQQAPQYKKAEWVDFPERGGEQQRLSGQVLQIRFRYIQPFCKERMFLIQPLDFPAVGCVVHLRCGNQVLRGSDQRKVLLWSIRSGHHNTKFSVNPGLDPEAGGFFVCHTAPYPKSLHDVKTAEIIVA